MTEIARGVADEHIVGGVPVSPFDSLEECARRILADALSGAGGFAIAINAEKVITCAADRDLEATVERATLRYPDGAGVGVVPKFGVSGVALSGAGAGAGLAPKLGVPVLKSGPLWPAAGASIWMVGGASSL